MKSSIYAVIVGAVMTLNAPCMAAQAQVQAPVTVEFPQGGQVRLIMSSTDPNLIIIPGDKVTAITAQGGMLADKRMTSAGGVMFTSVASRAFTLYVETASGQTVSIVATPIKGKGRVWRLISTEPPLRPETRKWETSQSYETLLISLNRAVLRGVMPEGYGEVKSLANAIRVPDGFMVTSLKAWAGDQVRADRYELRNENNRSVSLREQDFWKPGIRTVMFDNSAQALTEGGTMTLTVIRETRDGENGQR